MGTLSFGAASQFGRIGTNAVYVCSTRNRYGGSAGFHLKRALLACPRGLCHASDRKQAILLIHPGLMQTKSLLVSEHDARTGRAATREERR